MFLIYALLAALLVTAALYIVSIIFGYKNKLIRSTRSICATLCLILFVLSLAFGFGVRGDITNAHKRYDELMLYYNTVNYSTNEYVRYDYFDKVEAYNHWYDRLEEDSTSWFLSAFFPRGWNENFGSISFQLHGDEYVE